MKMACSYIKSNINIAVEDELSVTSEEAISISFIRAWKQLFVELSDWVTDEWLKEEVVPTIKSLIDLKHKIAVRKHGVNLLIDTCLKFGQQDILEHFKPLLIYWCRDLNWNIRFSIWEGMPKIWSCLAKESAVKIFYPELVELINDVEILVRLEAIETVFEMFDYFTEDQIKNDFYPILKQHLSADIDETWNTRMSKWIGKIAFCLHNYPNLVKELNDTLWSYYSELVEIDNQEVRMNVLYNLPGMYFVYHNGEIDIMAIVKQFAKDKDTRLRLRLAHWIHEIFGISTQHKGNALEFKELYFELIKDPNLEVLKTMINNLDEWAINFFKFDEKENSNNSKDSETTEDENEKIKHEYFSELLDVLVEVGESIAIQNPFLAKPLGFTAKRCFPLISGSWRTKLIFYEKLWSLFEVFNQEQLKQAFFESARYDFWNGAEPLRKQCSTLLSKIIYWELFSDEREKMLSSLIKELQNAEFIQRRWLLEFYESWIKIFSKKLWYKHWYDGFVSFSKDKINVLRVKFAKAIKNISCILTKQEIENLIEDSNLDVADLGAELITIVMKGKNTQREEDIQEEESKKLKFEKALKKREKQEIEERLKKEEEEKEKKDHMSQLTSQMNAKKKYLKIPGFKAKLLKKPRKRGSFTAGTRSKTSISSTSINGKSGSSTTKNSRKMTYNVKDKVKSAKFI